MEQDQTWGRATAAPPVAEGAWVPDPTGRYALRWWDGVAWTGHVARPDGAAAVDPNPVVAPAPTGASAGPVSGGLETVDASVAGATAWAPRPARPLVPRSRRRPSAAGLVLVAAGVAGLGLSLFAFAWISFSIADLCEVQGSGISTSFCTQLGDQSYSFHREDLVALVDEAEATGRPTANGPSEASLAYLRWGGAVGLVVLVVAALGAYVRVVPWLVVSALALVLAAWHGWALHDLSVDGLEQFLTFGAHAGWIAMLLAAAGGVVLHLGGRRDRA